MSETAGKTRGAKLTKNCPKVKTCYRDWSFHFSRGIVPTLSVYLVQGMGVPLKTKPEKPPRMQRSKTVRKYMKKIHKQRMKKKPT